MRRRQVAQTSARRWLPVPLVALLAILLVSAWPLRPRDPLPDPLPDPSRAGGSARLDEGPAGWRRIRIDRPAGGSFSALFFYPARSAGEDSAFDPEGGPYPGIAFGHGFAQTPDRYDGTLAHLAGQGYLVVAPESFTGILPAPDHDAFAEDLRLSLGWLEQAGAGALPEAAELAGAVDEESFGLSGHSMGGGAAVLAAARDPRVGALAPLAAAETSPSAVAAMSEVDVPALLLAGSEDAITPVEAAQAPIFDAGRHPRLLPIILGGSHCGFQDRPFPIACDQGSLDAETQLALTRRILTAFFDLHLKRDESRWRQVWGPELLEDPALEVRVDSGARLSVIMPWQQAAIEEAPDKPSDGMWLRNTGPLPTGYGISVEEASWPSRPSVERIAELAPGESAWFHLEVELPPNTPGQASDRALVSLQPEAHPGVRTYIWLTTWSAEWSGWHYLPWTSR